MATKQDKAEAQSQHQQLEEGKLLPQPLKANPNVSAAAQCEADCTTNSAERCPKEGMSQPSPQPSKIAFPSPQDLLTKLTSQKKGSQGTGQLPASGSQLMKAPQPTKLGWNWLGLAEKAVSMAPISTKQRGLGGAPLSQSSAPTMAKLGPLIEAAKMQVRHQLLYNFLASMVNDPIAHLKELYQRYAMKGNKYLALTMLFLC